MAATGTAKQHDSDDDVGSGDGDDAATTGTAWTAAAARATIEQLPSLAFPHIGSVASISAFGVITLVQPSFQDEGMQV